MLPTWGVGLRTPTQCRNNVHVVSASTQVAPRGVTSRPNLVSVGTIIWLSSELMFFAALFAMYYTIRSVDKGLGKPWPQAHLDLRLATIHTLVVLLSSVTCQLGVFAVERHQIKRSGSIWNVPRWGLREWYVLTFFMGLYFDLGQGYEWLSLIHAQHVTVASTNHGSVIYLTERFHGLLIAGGRR